MITIPTAIRDLINGSCRKRFRVHFPNGEKPDITNDNIVAESVSFKESVCSDSFFRFGRAESSEISFETVGIGNIQDCTIICSMEYEVPANLQSLYGQWYAIPYGKFVVDSCPRNHEDMTHRKVTAYSKLFSNDNLPVFEQWKMARPSYRKKWDMKPYYMMAEMGIVTPSTSALISGTAGTNSYLAYSNFEDGQTVTARFTTTYPANAYEVYTITDYDAIYKIDMVGSLDDVYEIYETHQITPKPVQVSATLEITDGNLNSVRYHIPLTDNGEGTISGELVYANCPQISSGDTVKIYIPTSLNLRLYHVPSQSGDWNETAVVATSVSLTKLTSTLPEAGITLSFGSTLTNDNKQYYYNAYSGRDIINGYAELTGRLVRTGRDGNVELVELDNSAPYPLNNSNVMGEMWWDEYDVSPIAIVKYVFTDKNQPANGELSFSDDGSVYDMSDNYVLSHLKDGSVSSVETLLKQLFKPKASAVCFTPIDANFNGLTFLQVGDAIQFTAGDGAVINSYIMAQSFNGIQLITQDVNTVQGEVLNEY